MQRFKIWIGAAVLVLVLLILTTSSNVQKETTADPETTISTPEPEEIVVDEKEVQRYRLFQKELKLALNTYFKKAIASGDIVGAGVSIVKGDSILISDGFGKRNVNKDEEVDGGTVFRLGSLSKGFAGVLAANLKSEGKLDWTDKIKDYLPEFQLGDSTNTDKITLANILSHTSGTPYHSFTNLIEAGLPMVVIAKRFKEVVPISEPGELYSYQNAMFALCGEVMKKATGKEITSLLEHRFFEPLGMQTVSTNYEGLMQTENVAIPHSRRRKGWSSRKLTDHYDNAVAAGGINASAMDMAKWMRFLLGHNPEVMEKEAIAEAFSPQVDINIGRKYYKRWPGHLSSSYGFGWRIHKFKDEVTKGQKTMWHHGGSVNSFRNEIAIYPENDFGICVLLNSNSRIARNVIPDLQKIVEDVHELAASKIDSNIPDNATSSL